MIKHGPAFQFYASDYLSSSKVQMMTLEEEGAYIRLLAYNWQDGFIPNDIHKLAKMCKTNQQKMKKIWNTLRENFLPLENDETKLANKKIEEVRQNQIKHRELQSISGKSGAEKRWRPHTAGYSDPIETPMAKNSSSSSSSSSSFSSKKNTPPTPSRGSGGVKERFEKFWESYPRKKSKGDAEKAWAKIKPSEQLHDAILKSLERAKTSEDWTKDGGQFIPYPSTWLNARGWEDEYTTAPTPAHLREKPKGCAKCQFSGLISPIRNGKVKTFRCDCDLGKTYGGIPAMPVNSEYAEMPEISAKARGDPPEKLEPVNFSAIAKIKNISQELVKGI